MEYFKHYNGLVYDKLFNFLSKATGVSRELITVLWIAFLEHIVSDDSGTYAPTLNYFDIDRFCEEFNTTPEVVLEVIEAMKNIGWIVGDANCLQYEGYWDV